MRSPAILALLAPMVSSIQAQTPEERGERLAAEVASRIEGYGSLSARLTIVIRGGAGEERTRRLRLHSRETADGERLLMVFDEPRDVRGTALLTAVHAEGEDERWLYLPAFKRVKRIASAARSGAFMGTDFAYEDLATQNAHRFRHRYIGEDVIDGIAALVVERTPLDPASQYRRQVVWVDREQLHVLRIEYHDRTDVIIKTLQLREYELHVGRYSRPALMEMINHRTGGGTIIRWSQYVFPSDLDQGQFEAANLGGVVAR